jgi:hypothetical protein
MLVESNDLHGVLKFKTEVLTAHSPVKKSYHIIIKMTIDGKQILLKDKVTCKRIAEEVINRLGQSIQVPIQKSQGVQPIVDLNVYKSSTQLMRITYSSKSKGIFRALLPESATSNRYPRDIVCENLVVPPSEIGNHLVIQSKHDECQTRGPKMKITPRVNKVRSQSGSGQCLGVPDDVYRRYYKRVVSLIGALPDANKRKVYPSDLVWCCKRDGLNRHLIHYTINRKYTSYCYNIGRSHTQHNIMISIDTLNDHQSYQSCWDQLCRNHDGRQYMYPLDG